MVKSYLRYEPAAALGVIASFDSNIAYDNSGKHLLAPALETVGVWHVRQGVCTKTLTPAPSFPGPSLAVTSIACSPSATSQVLSSLPPLFDSQMDCWGFEDFEEFGIIMYS